MNKQRVLEVLKANAVCMQNAKFNVDTQGATKVAITTQETAKLIQELEKEDGKKEMVQE